MADAELPEVQPTTAYTVHWEQHGHSDIRPGQIQPQTAAGLRDPRLDTEQRVCCLRVCQPSAEPDSTSYLHRAPIVHRIQHWATKTRTADLNATFFYPQHLISHIPQDDVLTHGLQCVQVERSHLLSPYASISLWAPSSTLLTTTSSFLPFFTKSLVSQAGSQRAQLQIFSFSSFHKQKKSGLWSVHWVLLI